MKKVSEIATHRNSLITYAATAFLGIVGTGGYQFGYAPAKNALDSALTFIEENQQVYIELQEDNLIEMRTANILKYGKNRVDSVRNQTRRDYLEAKWWNGR